MFWLYQLRGTWKIIKISRTRKLMLKNVLRCAHFPPGSPSLSKQTNYGASCVAKIRPFANRPGWVGFKQTFCIHIILQQCFGNKMLKYLYGYGPCAALESAFVPARFSSVFFSSGVLDTSQCPRMIWFKVYLSIWIFLWVHDVFKKKSQHKITYNCEECRFSDRTETHHLF